VVRPMNDGAIMRRVLFGAACGFVLAYPLHIAATPFQLGIILAFAFLVLVIPKESNQ
jgi:hypothetical protein